MLLCPCIFKYQELLQCSVYLLAKSIIYRLHKYARQSGSLLLMDEISPLFAWHNLSWLTKQLQKQKQKVWISEIKHLKSDTYRKLMLWKHAMMVEILTDLLGHKKKKKKIKLKQKQKKFLTLNSTYFSLCQKCTFFFFFFKLFFVFNNLNTQHIYFI